MNLDQGGLHMTQNLGCDVLEAKFHMVSERVWFIAFFLVFLDIFVSRFLQQIHGFEISFYPFSIQLF